MLPGDAAGRNVVITSGTGSGKTEAFLLPILARLVQESRQWSDDALLERWWEAGRARAPWRALRHASRRPAEVRTMVLYPTNALVEDQITRLRRALRRLARHPRGRELWFGRYTGATLGSGPLPSDSTRGDRLAETVGELQAMVAEYEALAAAGANEDLLNQFPDPRAGEMLTRWDMIADPPDVLVTNYSMLNAMLMRDLEEPMFERTREWLSSSDEHIFSLVIDELHLYRGTAGSEVALIIRNLLSRLGLEPASSQLRCIATSASLTPTPEGVGFLETFFGVPASTFSVIPGRPRRLDARLPVPRAAIAQASAQEGEARRAALRDLAGELQLPAAIARSCSDEDGQVRATKLADIAQALLDGPDPEGHALSAALEAAALLPSQGGGIPLRAHIFVRTVRGLWACSNPSCEVLDGKSGSRRIGRLFERPASTCSCGGRVLELLYCFECGDVSLGGFVVEEPSQGAYLVGPGPHHIPALEAQPVFRRPHGQYVWYWPQRPAPPRQWSHITPDGAKVTFGFASASYNPLLGYLEPSIGESDGTWLVTRGLPPEVISASPPCRSSVPAATYEAASTRSLARYSEESCAARSARTPLVSRRPLSCSSASFSAAWGTGIGTPDHGLHRQPRRGSSHCYRRRHEPLP